MCAMTNSPVDLRALLELIEEIRLKATGEREIPDCLNDTEALKHIALRCESVTALRSLTQPQEAPMPRCTCPRVEQGAANDWQCPIHGDRMQRWPKPSPDYASRVRDWINMSNPNLDADAADLLEEGLRIMEGKA